MKDAVATPPLGMRTGVTRLQSDERLVRRARNGDRRAFEAIYERYHQGLYRFCLMMVGSRQDAEDALQSTMVNVLRALPGERRTIKLRPWIYRIARNESIETLRRRRESAAVEPEALPAGPDLAETAEARERLARLLADLRELPERQRAALVMRELGDLEFSEIGSALGAASAGAARQTVYEARVSLRQMEAGREMSCEQVVWELSEVDGRVTRRREIQAHLRTCPDCRAFRDSITRRRGELRAVAPLPVAASAALLQGALGGASGAAGGGSVAGAAGAGAGKALLGSTVAKTAAACAVVAAIGTTAADRSGLIDVPIGGDRGQAAKAPPPSLAHPARSVAPAGVGAGARAAADRDRGSTRPALRTAAGAVDERNRNVIPGSAPEATSAPPEAATTPHGRGLGGTKPKKNAAKRGQGKAPGLPPSSAHGQGNAAVHKSPNANATPGNSRGAAKGQSSPPPSSQSHQDAQPDKSPPPAAPAAEPPAYGKGGNSADRATGKPSQEAEVAE